VTLRLTLAKAWGSAIQLSRPHPGMRSDLRKDSKAFI